ncbi:unnamed protein product, partial [Arabidopsis halleri]
KLFLSLSPTLSFSLVFVRNFDPKIKLASSFSSNKREV